MGSFCTRDSAEAFSDPAAEPWATKEFRIKWKRYSYTHCTWESLDTLRQLPGFKRVANYMRRADEVGQLRMCLLWHADCRVYVAHDV